MSTYTISNHTPAEYTAMAEDCTRNEQESWERSDTDGFLSQWASRSMARTYRRLAELAANGGDVQEIDWVFTADGTPVQEFSYVQGQYGTSIRIFHEGKVSWFNQSHAKKAVRREATDRKKGYTLGRVRAYVILETRAAKGSYSTFDVLTPASDNSSAIVEIVTPAHYEDYKD